MVVGPLTRFLFHERDGGRALDGHNGVHQVEGGIEAAAEGVDFKDDVVRIFLESVIDGAGAEIVHGRLYVTFQLNPDCMLFSFLCNDRIGCRFCGIDWGD